ncbi:hypothetical protein DIJ64_07155 [Mycobacterium leprae]|uniref:Uncharacterized protein n=3 Tax=Mycobacterium leprae TaxID=1769 RepID=A0AAD2PSV1_MYCLR|nr:hypothetical protein DIJ64_07155 [Mycobacterium leprae]OAR20076.1 hypothetical protein A8144_12355 [Mycobacterium leprae 3125609]OAX70421.1 hypothetical protein A3216_12025 [Mycobacterium leprae 7935681]
MRDHDDQRGRVTVLMVIVKSERVADLLSSVLVVARNTDLGYQRFGIRAGMGDAHDTVTPSDSRCPGGPNPPVVLLTTLVVFNTYVWIVATTLIREHYGWR